jgi:regulator of sigma E protease
LVDRVEQGSLAAHAGMVAGQEIVSVNGIKTPTRSDVFQELLVRVGDTGVMAVGVRHPGDDLTYELLIDLDRWLSDADQPDPVAGLGMHFYLPPFVMVGGVVSGSPAEQSGLHAGDVIERMDGRSIADVEEWLAAVRSKPGQQLLMSVRRDGVLLDIRVTPATVTGKDGKTVGQIGAQVGSPALDSQHIRKIDYTFFQALVRGVDETSRQSALIFRSLYKLVLGDMSPKNLSGPLGIAKVAGTSASIGVAAFCHMLAILSISLGVMNILPIPMLDGGHLLMCLVEAVKGSPVSEKIQMLGNQVGLALIISMMLFAVYNDLLKLL